MESKKVKEFVKKRYGEIAQTDETCCCSSSCCSPSTKEIAEEIGYSETELKNVPDSAILGLGCGNPVALANLKEGDELITFCRNKELCLKKK